MAKSKIYPNLEETEFTYNTDHFIFYFSSLFYKNKFTEEVQDFRDKINNKFKGLYLMPTNLDDYADIVYYSKVEKRGFRVKIIETNEVVKWLGSITLDGVIRTNGNSRGE